MQVTVMTALEFDHKAWKSVDGLHTVPQAGSSVEGSILKLHSFSTSPRQYKLVLD